MTTITAKKPESRADAGLEDAEAAKARAIDLLRKQHFERSFEVLEFELEREHQELIRYHEARLAKKLRWILQSWKDEGEDCPGGTGYNTPALDRRR